MLGGIVPYLLLDEDSGRLHDDIDTICKLEDVEKLRKAIEEAIVPDTYGNNGVTIKFKGSPIKQKEFYITAEEIAKARESGNYSSGDDDMIAFELATEKTFKAVVSDIGKENVYQRIL